LEQRVEVNMNKIVIKILQGSVVTQTALGELAIHSLVANFLQYMYAINYENWLAVNKVIEIIKGVPFLWPTVYM